MTARVSFSLGGLAAAQLVVGLALQFIVLIVVGAGPTTDAFAAAQTVPMLLFGILATPLQNIWLPRLAVLSHDTEKWRTAQGVAQGQLLLLVGTLAVVLGIAAPLWIRLIFRGLTTAQIDLAIDISRILLFATYVNGQTALFTVALRARGRFIAPEIVIFVVSLGAVAATFLVVPRFGVLGAAWVNAVRSALVTGILYFLAERPAFSVVAAAKDSELWRQVRPLLAGSSLYKCDPLVDRFWGSQAAAGGLTILTLSQTGMGAAGQILERSVCMPMVPQLARMAEAHNYEGMRALYRRCIFRVSAFAGAFLLLLLLAYPIWDAAMHRAFKLSPDAARQMWLVCLMLVGFLHVAASGAVPVAAFYALGDTKTPVRSSIVAFTIGIGVKSLCFIWFGLPGLAFGTSAYYLGNLLSVSLLLESRLTKAAGVGH